MSKKRKTTKNFRTKHPREIGKFYNINDNKGGHPGKVFYANPEEDVYFIVKFSTKPRKDRIPLLHSIDPNKEHDQFVVKHPIESDYDGMEYKEKYSSFRVHPDDIATVKAIEEKYLREKKKWHLRVA